jgi:hemerythrin-like metal-binding protein
MELIKFEKKFETKIKEIDEQHKVLFEIFNKLYSLLLSPHSFNEIQDILNQLTEYTLFHFANEEKLMERYSYPKLDEHLNMHHSFIKKVETFKLKYEMGDMLLNTHIFTYIYDWLTNHILFADKDFANYTFEQ